jgi:formiminotetrahydrofolate cyclodeaminase
MNDQNQQLDFLDFITIISFCIQLSNVQKNAKQLSNDDIMHELQVQDEKFLKTIIENQNKIMSMLENSKPEV